MEVNTLIPTPHVIIDITETFYTKVEAIRLYHTQLAKFSDEYDQRFNKVKAELRGVQGGCYYAEAFIVERLTENSPFYEARSTQSLFRNGGQR